MFVRRHCYLDFKSIVTTLKVWLRKVKVEYFKSKNFSSVL